MQNFLLLFYKTGCAWQYVSKLQLRSLALFFLKKQCERVGNAIYHRLMYDIVSRFLFSGNIPLSDSFACI